MGDGLRLTGNTRGNWQSVFPRSMSIPILSGLATVISTLQRGQLQESTCAWHWLRRDHGNKVALDVARAMVMFLFRPGNQAQFSVLLAAESAVSPPIRKLQTWFPEHLTEDLSVSALARRAGMSPRTFQRIFTHEIGKAPSLYVEELRIEAVRRKLELTSLRLSEIAEQCGFASGDVMTRRFRFHLKVKPLDYRARFRSSIGLANLSGRVIRRRKAHRKFQADVSKETCLIGLMIG